MGPQLIRLSLRAQDMRMMHGNKNHKSFLKYVKLNVAFKL